MKKIKLIGCFALLILLPVFVRPVLANTGVVLDDPESECRKSCEDDSLCYEICMSDFSDSYVPDFSPWCKEICGEESGCYDGCIELNEKLHGNQSNINNLENPAVSNENLRISSEFMSDLSILNENGMLGNTPYNVTYHSFPEDIDVELTPGGDGSFIGQTGGFGKNIIIHYNISWNLDNASSYIDWRWPSCTFIAREMTETGKVIDNAIWFEFWLSGKLSIRNVNSYNDQVYLVNDWFSDFAAKGKASVTIALVDQYAGIVYNGELAAQSEKVTMLKPGFWGFLVQAAKGQKLKCSWSDIELLEYN